MTGRSLVVPVSIVGSLEITGSFTTIVNVLRAHHVDVGHLVNEAEPHTNFPFKARLTHTHVQSLTVSLTPENRHHKLGAVCGKRLFYEESKFLTNNNASKDK